MCCEKHGAKRLRLFSDGQGLRDVDRCSWLAGDATALIRHQNLRTRTDQTDQHGCTSMLRCADVRLDIDIGTVTILC
nr:hypothetical protein CFP56_30720 [Quercus suber]